MRKRVVSVCGFVISFSSTSITFSRKTMLSTAKSIATFNQDVLYGKKSDKQIDRNHWIYKSIFGIFVYVFSWLFSFECVCKWAAMTRHTTHTFTCILCTQCTLCWKHVHKLPSEYIIILRILWVHDDFIYSFFLSLPRSLSFTMCIVKCQCTSYVRINMSVSTHAHIIYVYEKICST